MPLSITGAKKSKAATKQSWARANRLKTLTNKKATTTQARRFLSLHSENGYTTLLDDQNADKRNPNIRDMITAFDAWNLLDGPLDIDNLSKAQGLRRRRTTTSQRETKLQEENRNPTKGNTSKSVNPSRIPAAVLIDLRKLQKKHGSTTQELAYCVNLLGQLLDEPLDIDNFLKSVKTT